MNIGSTYPLPAPYRQLDNYLRFIDLPQAECTSIAGMEIPKRKLGFILSLKRDLSHLITMVEAGAQMNPSVLFSTALKILKKDETNLYPVGCSNQELTESLKLFLGPLQEIKRVFGDLFNFLFNRQYCGKDPVSTGAEDDGEYLEATSTMYEFVTKLMSNIAKLVSSDTPKKQILAS